MLPMFGKRFAGSLHEVLDKTNLSLFRLNTPDAASSQARLFEKYGQKCEHLSLPQPILKRLKPKKVRQGTYATSETLRGECKWLT